jgi:hypothetical protein
MKLKQYWFALLLFTGFPSFSQKLNFNDQPLFFKESMTNEIVVIDSEETINKLNKNVKIPLKHNGFLGKLIDYRSFSIKNKTFLAHRGCGPVLEYRNDSLVRIDNSFLQLNQLGASNFVYNNEIYFFGGYGLFTFKNILTKFDFLTKEWLLIKTKNNKLVEPLSDCFYFKSDSFFYVFGGFNQNDEGELIFNKRQVFRLDLRTFTWEKFRTDFFNVGTNRSISPKTGTSFFEYKGNLIIKEDKQLYKINFLKNEVTLYNTDVIIPSISMIYSNNKVYSLLENFNHSNKQKFSISSFPINDILKNPISQAPFYYEEQPYYLYGLFFVVVVGFGFLLYKKRIFISFYLNPSHPFQYWQKTELLYFKGKKVKHLSEDDIKILNKMALHPNQFISLNEFNEMFTIDYETENYAAIVKRREKKLEVFLKLLANVSSYDIKDLLHERKNDVDKRIKEVLFLPNKIKFIQK